jgi:hypothetical protein
MLGELSLVYVGMPRNSARLVALLLNRQIMREDGAKTMSKGVTGEIRGPGDTTGTTSRDVTSMTTNDATCDGDERQDAIIVQSSASMNGALPSSQLCIIGRAVSKQNHREYLRPRVR